MYYLMLKSLIWSEIFKNNDVDKSIELATGKEWVKKEGTVYKKVCIARITHGV